MSYATRIAHLKLECAYEVLTRRPIGSRRSGDDSPRNRPVGLRHIRECERGRHSGNSSSSHSIYAKGIGQIKSVLG